MLIFSVTARLIMGTEKAEPHSESTRCPTNECKGNEAPTSKYPSLPVRSISGVQ